MNSIDIADALCSVTCECARTSDPLDRELLAAVRMTLSWVLGLEGRNESEEAFNAMLAGHAVRGRRLREAVLGKN